MPHEFDPGRPIYNQLAELITLAILSGTLAPGQKLPGVREMAAEYGVNPNTVQRTMAELERRGLVYAERTAGRYVSTDTMLIDRIRKEEAIRQASDFMKQMKKLGLNTAGIISLLAEAEKYEGENNG